LDPEWEHLPCKLETAGRVGKEVNKKLTHGNVQPMRFLYASILAAGAREMQAKAVERELRWTSEGMWSATNEHEGQPASQVGPNMKW
jgi:hypothetical protein